MTRPFVALAVLFALALLGWHQRAATAPVTVQRSRILMGTVVEITAVGPERAPLEKAINDAFREMEHIDHLMSPRIASSDLARLSGPIRGGRVAPETAAVIALGERVARASGGAFDMGLGRLKQLWNIESPHPRVPSAGEIRRALVGTGLGDLTVIGKRRVRKDSPRLKVDLGGIAKGYAVDRAEQVLRREGVKSAAINAGGDIRLIGRHGKRPWRIGIQHPRIKDRVLAVLKLENTAVVTSGDYERYFIRNGVRYHHIFDPKTGYPASRCQSVTVVADNATLADALATAAFVLGPRRGAALLRRFPGTAGVLVGADGKPVVTPGLAGRVEWP